MKQLERDWLCGRRVGVSHPKFSLHGQEGVLVPVNGIKKSAEEGRRGLASPCSAGTLPNSLSFSLHGSRGGGSSQAPSTQLFQPLLTSEELDYLHIQLQLILDFPSLGGENEAES